MESTWSVFATSFQGQAVLGRIEKYPGEHSKLSITVLQYPASAFNIAGSIAILEDDSPQATFLSICSLISLKWHIGREGNSIREVWWPGGNSTMGSVVILQMIWFSESSLPTQTSPSPSSSPDQKAQIQPPSLPSADQVRQS